MLDEGDEVILPAPYWVSYSEIAKLAGAKPVPVVSRAEDEFVVNPDAVAKAITPRTRMLLVVSPCNPTGAVYDEKTLRALADLAVKHDLWLLTDDIYRSLIYGDAKFVQPASFGPEVKKRTIIADGVSKTFAMTGWRVGFAMAPPAGHRGDGHPAGPVHHQRRGGQPGGRAGGHRGPDGRGGEDAPGLRQPAQVHGPGAAGHPGREVRGAARGRSTPSRTCRRSTASRRPRAR